MLAFRTNSFPLITDKCRDKIRATINETFKNFYPEKILTFINNTAELLFIERIKLNFETCFI